MILPSEAPVVCLQCGSENLSGQKYCGECGRPLSESVLNADMISAIDARIRSALHEQLQDQATLEIKTAQAVVTRVTDWAKLFALVTAVPVTVLLATLAIWGITSFLDFHKKVDNGKIQITADIENAKAVIKSTQDDTLKLKAELDAAHAQLGSLPSDVKSLQSKVATLEEKIEFVATPSLTPSLKEKLKTTLEGFQNYCRSIGFAPKSGHVNVRIQQDLQPPGSAAYYDSSKSEMIVDASVAGDSSFSLREYMHRTLYPAAELNGETVGLPEYYAIESGMASYFPASFLNTSHTSNDDLSQITQFPADRKDIARAMFWGSKFWGSAFWELRATIGQEACDKLLVQFWKNLDPKFEGPYSSHALSQLLDIYRSSGGRDEAKVRAIFSRRGLS